MILRAIPSRKIIGLHRQTSYTPPRNSNFGAHPWILNSKKEKEKEKTLLTIKNPEWVIRGKQETAFSKINVRNLTEDIHSQNKQLTPLYITTSVSFLSISN